MSPGRPAAVVLGGDYDAVEAARSLAPRGVEVHVLHDGRGRASIRASRHITSWVRAPSGQDPTPRWRQWLAEGPPGAVLIPGSDEGLGFVLDHGDELRGAGYRPAEHDREATCLLLSKSRTYAFAAEHGIDHPRSVEVATLADAREAADRLGYPCALKPARTDEFVRRTGGQAGKGVVVDRPDALADAYAITSRGGATLLVTEFVPGPDHHLWGYVTYLDEHQRPLAHFVKRKLRQWPPRFGSGTANVTVWDPEVAETGLRILQAAGLRGVGAVELKRDERDDRLVLIECNARLIGFDALVQRSGLDLPWLSYARALGRRGQPVADHLAPPEEYREGLVLWIPADDVQAFRSQRRAGELTTWGWLRSIGPRARIPLLRLGDPLPWLADLVGRIRAWWHRR